MSALGDKNIGRLDVAVDDPFGVRGIERVGNLNRQSEKNVGLDGSAGDAMLQRYPVEKLHNQEGMTILLPDLIDGADIGMIECRSRLCLPLEPRQRLSVFDDVIGQKLQGDKAVQGCVFRLVDNAHAAATKLLDDPVVRDGLANHGQRWLVFGSLHLTDAASARQRLAPHLSTMKRVSNSNSLQKVLDHLQLYEHPLLAFSARDNNGAVEIVIDLKNSTVPVHTYVLPIHSRDLDHPQFAWHLQRQIYDGLHDYFIEMFIRTPQDRDNPLPAKEGKHGEGDQRG